MPGTVTRRCHCKHSDTGKELGAACPDRKSSKHGDWEYRDRLTTSTGRRSYRRGGHARKVEAEEYGRRVRELVALAKGDPLDEKRVGDLLFTIKRGGDLPASDYVRRRLGLRDDLTQSMTAHSWFEQWFTSKRALRESTAETYRSHLDIYLIPFLGEIPLDRLRPEHITEMFDRIGEWNAEIAEARAEGRRPLCEGDVRKKQRVITNTTQRRVFATLRNSLNAAWKGRRIDTNPALFVEMPPEENEPPRVWSPEQVAQFFDYIEGDRLALMFRLILLHGPRRGEAVGARWAGLDEKTATLTLQKTILSLSGRIIPGTPKTRAGVRVLHLDPATLEMLRRHRTAQKREKMQMGVAYEDDDLIFAKADGSPFPPDLVSRHFREACAAAGLPRIKLHEGRHTAATLALEAGIDIKIVSKRMGHSTTTFTQNRYQHVRPAVLDTASEKVVALLPERHRQIG